MWRYCDAKNPSLWEWINILNAIFFGAGNVRVEKKENGVVVKFTKEGENAIGIEGNVDCNLAGLLSEGLEVGLGAESLIFIMREGVLVLSWRGKAKIWVKERWNFPVRDEPVFTEGEFSWREV